MGDLAAEQARLNINEALRQRLGAENNVIQPDIDTAEIPDVHDHEHDPHGGCPPNCDHPHHRADTHADDIFNDHEGHDHGPVEDIIESEIKDKKEAIPHGHEGPCTAECFTDQIGADLESDKLLGDKKEANPHGHDGPCTAECFTDHLKADLDADKLLGDKKELNPHGHEGPCTAECFTDLAGAEEKAKSTFDVEPDSLIGDGQVSEQELILHEIAVEREDEARETFESAEGRAEPTVEATVVDTHEQSVDSPAEIDSPRKVETAATEVAEEVPSASIESDDVGDAEPLVELGQSERIEVAEVPVVDQIVKGFSEIADAFTEPVAAVAGEIAELIDGDSIQISQEAGEITPLESIAETEPAIDSKVEIVELDEEVEAAITDGITDELVMDVAQLISAPAVESAPQGSGEVALELPESHVEVVEQIQTAIIEVVESIDLSVPGGSSLEPVKKLVSTLETIGSVETIKSERIAEILNSLVVIMEQAGIQDPEKQLKMYMNEFGREFLSALILALKQIEQSQYIEQVLSGYDPLASFKVTQTNKIKTFGKRVLELLKVRRTKFALSNA